MLTECLPEKLSFNIRDKNEIYNNYKEYCLKFNFHGLKDVGGLSLMKRQDTKYIININKLEDIFNIIKDDYTILKVNGESFIKYENTYYDTKQMKLYNLHHNNCFSRLKIRVRQYQNSLVKYLEIKIKSNKNITVKERIEIPMNGSINDRESNIFLESMLGKGLTRELNKKLIISYYRISLMSKKYNERVSIDFNLSAKNICEKTIFHLVNHVVIEIKQERNNRNSLLSQTMKSLKCRPLSFSKYCISCALLYSNIIKTNRFKNIISKLNPYLIFITGNMNDA